MDLVMLKSSYFKSNSRCGWNQVGLDSQRDSSVLLQVKAVSRGVQEPDTVLLGELSHNAWCTAEPRIAEKPKDSGKGEGKGWALQQECAHR